MRTDVMVSVIVLTYNQEQMIAQTLDSIVNQKTKYTFEVIIGEDFGNDNTRSICQSYADKDQRVLLTNRIRNLGVVGNMVDCLKYAKGKYIMFCAGDDYWHNSNKIELQVDFMENNPDCVILHTDYDELNIIKNKIIRNYNLSKDITPPEGFIQKIIVGGKSYITAPSACYRHSTIQQFLNLEDFFNLGFPIEDWPMQVILSKYGTVKYLPISTVTYRKGHATLSNFVSIEKAEERFKNEKVMQKYLNQLFPDVVSLDEESTDNYINHVMLRTAYKGNDYKSVKKYGKLSNNKNLMKKCSQNWFTFKVYILLSKLNEIINKE